MKEKMEYITVAFLFVFLNICAIFLQIPFFDKLFGIMSAIFMIKALRVKQ